MPGERAPEPVMVQEKGNGHLRLVEPGTGAVLHGLMNMLSEVLDGLDRRLDAMEARLTALAEAEPPSSPPPPPVDDQLRPAIEQLVARIEGLDAAVAEQVSSLSADVAGATAGLADIESALLDRLTRAESALAERIAGLDEAVADRRVEASKLEQALMARLDAAVDDRRAETSNLEQALIARIDEGIADRRAEATNLEQALIARIDEGIADRRVQTTNLEQALIARIDEAVADRRAEATNLEHALMGRLDALEAVLDERIDAMDAAVDRVGAVEQGVNERVGRIEQVVAERIGHVEAAVAERMGHVETAIGERLAGIHTAVHDAIGPLEQSLTRLAAQTENALVERLQPLGGLYERSLAQSVQLEEAAGAIAAVERTLGDTAVRVEEVVQAAVGRRMAQIEASLAEARAEAEAAQRQTAAQLQEALDSRLGAVGHRLDEVAGQLADRIGQAEQMTVAHAEKVQQHIDQTAAATTAAVAAARADTADAIAQSSEAVTLQLSELDAALAALRAESAGLAANVSDQVQAAIGSWRNRLRRGESDESVRKAFEDLGAQITATAETLSDGLARVHEAVNRAQGESLEAAQTTTAEVRRLLEAARADTERHNGEQLDGVAAIAERLVVLHEDLSRRDARLAQALKQAAEATSARIESCEQALTQTITGAESDDEEVRNWLNDEFARLRTAVQEAHVRAGTVAATVARQVDEVVQAAVAAVTDRVANERTTADGIRRDVEVLGSRIEELGKSVSAGRREFAATAQGLPDLIRHVVDVDAIAQGDKAVLDAVAAANQEHQEVLQALHSSLAKRFDARTRAIADTLDGLSTSLEAARTLGPSLDKVSSRLDAQQPHLDQIRHQLVQLAATVTSVPADVERRHNEALTALDRVTDGLSTLRKHAASLDRAVQSMRQSHDGLAAAIIDIRDGHGVVPQRLDQIGASLDSTRRQLSEVVETSRAVAGTVDQQQAMGNRLAELITQVRAATRSDIERVESSIHLEVLKQHQQDQARLTQAVAGVSEVVEREAGVMAQRISALANEVDAIRLELSAGQQA